MTPNNKIQVKDLQLKRGFWPILALDHGLTVGHKESVDISLVPKILEGCGDTVGSVVMTYGLAKYTIPKSVEIPLIIQCFGAPHQHPKFKVCNIDQVLALEAKGVAVQVNFGLRRKKLNELLKEVSKLTQQAHKEGLPVLFMVNPDINDLITLSKTIRFCLELGADLIKIRYNTLKLDSEEKEDLKKLLKFYPPVLLSGGGLKPDIIEQVKVAKEVGFSGYCIGRNIFQHKNPVEMSQKLSLAWDK